MLTPEQISVRRTGIGGSDIGAISGLSPYRTPLDVYLEKIGEAPPFTGNQYTEWGNRLESIIAVAYAEKTGKQVVEDNETKRHPEHSFMIAHIDGKIGGEDAILECKSASVSQASKWGEEGTDQIPDSYLLQCAHYAYVCNVSRVDIAVLIGGNDFRIYRYERNQILEDRILNIATKFWKEHVEKGIPPMPINRVDSLNLWPRADVECVRTADKNIAKIVDHLKATRGVIRQLEEKEEEYKSAICKYLETSATLFDVNGEKLVTWKNQESSRFNLNQFKSLHPDLYQKFCNKADVRVLRIML